MKRGTKVQSADIAIGVIDYAIQHTTHTHTYVRTVLYNGTLHIRTSQIPHTPIFHITYDHSNFNIHFVDTNTFATNTFDAFTHTSLSYNKIVFYPKLLPTSGLFEPDQIFS